MGLGTVSIISILQLAFEKGLKNKSLCMMGKQDIEMNVFDIPPFAVKFDFPYDETIFKQMSSEQTIDSYKFFKMFGFSEVHAVDYSPYEGADIVFDLTDDLPENLYHRFDYVIDGGTLEHTFDPAKSIKNMSNMVKKGGLIVHILPLSGFVNHGFYSFSPDFFLEFYQANGFYVRDLKMRFQLTTNGKDVCMFSPDCRLLTNNINQYIDDVCRIGHGVTYVFCVAEKVKDGNSNVYPIQGRYQEAELAVQPLLSGWKEAIVNFLKAQHGKRVAFYGKGKYFDLLLDELFMENMEDCSKYVFDSDPRRAGSVYRGYKVLCPTKEKLDSFDIILVTNILYANEIVAYLRTFGEDIATKTYTLQQITNDVKYHS